MPYANATNSCILSHKEQDMQLSRIGSVRLCLVGERQHKQNDPSRLDFVKTNTKPNAVQATAEALN